MKEINEGLSSLLGPSDLVTRGLVLLGNSMSANTTSVLGERDSSLVFQDVFQITSSLGQSQTLNSISDFAAVLVVNTDVSSSGLDG